MLVTACNGTTKITSSPQSLPLRVSYSLWPGYFPLLVASEKGFFQKQGVKVELVYWPNYAASMPDFIAGKYDGITLALGSAMSAIQKNFNAQIVLALDRSAGADVVVAQPSIQSIANLKGKRIGVKIGDFGELFVIEMLKTHNLSINDIKFANMEGQAIPTQLKKGNIQAGHTWKPYLLQSAKNGARVIFTSKETPGLITDLVVFRNDVLRDRREDIKAFIRGWFQGVDYWKTHPEESKILITKKLNLKLEEVSTEGIDLLNLEDNLKAFTPGSTTESLYHTAKLYADFYTRTGAISAMPDIQKLINPSFVQQLASES